MAKKISSTNFISGLALVGTGAALVATGGLAAIPIALAAAGTAVMALSSPAKSVRTGVNRLSKLSMGLGILGSIAAVAAAPFTAGASLAFLPATLSAAVGGMATHAATKATEPTAGWREPSTGTRIKRFFGSVTKFAGFGVKWGGLGVALGAIATIGITIATGGAGLALPIAFGVGGLIASRIGKGIQSKGQSLEKTDTLPEPAKPKGPPVGAYVGKGVGMALSTGSIIGIGATIAAAVLTGGLSLIPTVAILGGCVVAGSLGLRITEKANTVIAERQAGTEMQQMSSRESGQDSKRPAAGDESRGKQVKVSKADMQEFKEWQTAKTGGKTSSSMASTAASTQAKAAESAASAAATETAAPSAPRAA